MGSGLTQISVCPCTAVPPAAHLRVTTLRIQTDPAIYQNGLQGPRQRQEWSVGARGYGLHMVKTHRGRKGNQRESLSQSSSRKASRRRKLPGAGGINGGKWLCVSWARDWMGQRGLGVGRTGGIQQGVRGWRDEISKQGSGQSSSPWLFPGPTLARTGWVPMSHVSIRWGKPGFSANLCLYKCIHLHAFNSAVWQESGHYLLNTDCQVLSIDSDRDSQGP